MFEVARSLMARTCGYSSEHRGQHHSVLFESFGNVLSFGLLYKKKLLSLLFLVSVYTAECKKCPHRDP